MALLWLMNLMTCVVKQQWWSSNAMFFWGAFGTLDMTEQNRDHCSTFGMTFMWNRVEQSGIGVLCLDTKRTLVDKVNAKTKVSLRLWLQGQLSMIYFV